MEERRLLVWGLKKNNKNTAKKHTRQKPQETNKVAYEIYYRPIAFFPVLHSPSLLFLFKVHIRKRVSSNKVIKDVINGEAFVILDEIRMKCIKISNSIFC